MFKLSACCDICTQKTYAQNPCWKSHTELAAKQRSGYYCQRHVAFKLTTI